MIRLIAFARAFNIASNEEDTRKQLLLQGFPVYTVTEGNVQFHYVDTTTFDAIVAKKREERCKEIERKQRELASFEDLVDKLIKEWEDKTNGKH